MWFLKKVNTELPYDPKELKANTQRDIYTPIFIAELFKLPRGGSKPSVHPQIKKINKIFVSIHTMEYDPVLTRKGILSHATTWMNSEHIIPSEISQSQ